MAYEIEQRFEHIGTEILEASEMRSTSICGIWMWRFQALHGR